jgi:peptidyl-prolyl cis-trans isomerase SurA
VNRPFRLAAAMVAFSAVPLPAQQEQRMVDGIAAVVNSNVITYGQVRELLMFRQRSLNEVYQGEELKAKMKESQDAALKDLVDRQIIIDEFKTQGFHSSEQATLTKTNIHQCKH